MPLLVLILVALLAGALVAYVDWRIRLHLADAPAVAVLETQKHPRLRSAIVRRLSGGRFHAAEATGVALLVAFVVTVVGASVVGALTLLLRTGAGGLGVDSSVANWGQDHASDWGTDAIRTITDLGDTLNVILIGLVVAVVSAAWARDRSDLWTVPFLIVVIAGNSALYNVLKQLMDRARPAFDENTASLGPAFPSGHSATAAASYAAIAFVLARRSSVPVRALFAGAAVAIAVAVAFSRVMLGVHWLTDTICGLALGWAWCAVVVVAFGGRVLRFGATAEALKDTTQGARQPGRDDALEEP